MTKKILVGLMFSIPMFAALSASTTWEVRTAGSDTNGGGFVTGAAGTDYSQNNNANSSGCSNCGSSSINLSTTDAVTAGTTTITSATASFTSAIVGNVVYITGGTGSIAGAWYQVVTYTNVTTIVVDRSTGLTTGTGATMNIGGALASPGQAGGNKVAGNNVFIQSGTYSITSATANISGGVVTDTTGGVFNGAQAHWTGYNTNRTLFNSDTKPLLQASGAISSFTIVAVSANYSNVSNISIDCATKATSIGLNFEINYGTARYIQAKNCTTYGVENSAAAYPNFEFIEATGNSGTYAIYIPYGNAAFLEAHGNTGSGISMGATSYIASCFRCLSYANTGASSDGFVFGGYGMVCINCTSYGNARYGFNIGSSPPAAVIINGLAEANTNVGFYTSGAAPGAQLLNCAGYNNDSTTSLSGQYSSNITWVSGFVNNTTGSFFVAAGSGNFALNSTANQGSLLRSIGFPSTFPSGNTASYDDIGAARHQDPSGSGGQSNNAYVQ